MYTLPYFRSQRLTSLPMLTMLSNSRNSLFSFLKCLSFGVRFWGIPVMFFSCLRKCRLVFTIAKICCCDVHSFTFTRIASSGKCIRCLPSGCGVCMVRVGVRVRVGVGVGVRVRVRVRVGVRWSSVLKQLKSRIRLNCWLLTLFSPGTPVSSQKFSTIILSAATRLPFSLCMMHAILHSCPVVYCRACPLGSRWQHFPCSNYSLITPFSRCIFWTSAHPALCFPCPWRRAR